MLDIKRLRENPEQARKAIRDRGGRYLPILEESLKIDGEKLKLQKEVEDLRAKRNKSADEIGKLKREKKDASSLIRDMETHKKSLKRKENTLGELDSKLQELLLSLPNFPFKNVPLGKGPEENSVVREIGTKPSFDFDPQDHTTIGEKLGILDFAAAGKISGSRFSVLMGAGARLERALISFMLDLHTKEHGYTEVLPPFLVNARTMTGTGQLPKFSEELYRCADDDLYLIPTAEVPLTSLLSERLPEEKELPIRYCAHTACFRREAGSYGKDTRGLIRNHQFNKIELVRFSRPEDVEKELELLTGHAEEVLKKLGLFYRVIELCTGDLGFSSAKTYDLEVWMPGEKNWREISSCSIFTDFQARRIGLRFKRANGQKESLNTLNGSGVAVGRTFAAILENFQEPNGHIKIPEVLVPYFGSNSIERNS